jgi:hypothetical protein
VSSSVADTFTVTNTGSNSAAYALTAGCGPLGTLANCILGNGSLSLAPGASSPVVVQYTRAGAADVIDTLKLFATYTSPLGGVIADTGRKLVVAPSVEAVPAVTGVQTSFAVPPRVVMARGWFTLRNNGTAQAEYHGEVREVLELINVAIVQQKVKDITAPDARSLVREVQDTGETIKGVKPEDLLFVPDVKFYRKRGMEEVVYMPYDVRGNLLTEDGKPISGEQYLAYLATVLPDYFMKTKEFTSYREALLGHEQPTAGKSYGW